MTVFRGAGVALVTLFDQDGRVLFDETVALAASLAHEGVAGVLVAGTTGEFWTLEEDERLGLVAAVRAGLSDDVPVIAGIGAVREDDALRLAAQVEQTGADAALCFVPPGSDPGAFYSRVRDALPDLPLLAYHFPAAGYADLPVDELAAYGVDGIKDSSGDPSRLAQTSHVLHAGVYTGSALLATLAAALPVEGCLLALANAAPRAAAAAARGDLQAQAELASLHLEITGDAPPRGVKNLVAQRHGTPPFTRQPSLREAW